MASGSTISVTFKVTDADGSWKKLSGDAEGFKKVVESTLQPVDNLQKKVINWTAASQALSNMQTAVSNLQSFMGGLTKAYDIQIQNEMRLATVMKQRMSASDADIQAMKDLASAQQEVGVIGDEVQLAGMQQIATFATQTSTIEKLTPAMNNLLAQQKGLNATTEDAQSIGNLFGKALQGQVSALKRVGISFTDAEANVLKYGTEEERAAMLAQVVQNNVGSMNQTLAQTDAGQQKQVANALGDQEEVIGGMLEPISGVVASMAQMGFMVTNITQLTTSFMALGSSLLSIISIQGLHAAMTNAQTVAMTAFEAISTITVSSLTALGNGIMALFSMQTYQTAATNLATAATTTWHAVQTAITTVFTTSAAAIKALTTATTYHTVAAKVATAATQVWRGVQIAMNLVLTANPIGIAIAAISALVGVIVLAYKNSDSFRQMCLKVWTVTKNLASMVWNKLCSAFETLGGYLAEAWSYVKALFGITSDPFVNLTGGANNASDALEDLMDKYEDFKPGKVSTGGGSYKVPKMSTGGTTGENLPLEGSIAYYEKKMQAANEAIQNAVTLEARQSAQTMADAYSAQINRIKAMIKGGIFEGKDIQGSQIGGGISDIASVINSLKDKKLKNIQITATKTKESWQDAARAIQQAGQSMQNMGSPVLNVMGTIAQAIATIALSFAQATSKDSKLGTFGWIAAVAGGLATMISTISAIKSATAFANGGVIYGPTLGLMGEYAGASSNPEIVAPLNKLQSMINPSGQMSGQVEFKLVGKALRGVLVNTDSRSSKIR